MNVWSRVLISAVAVSLTATGLLVATPPGSPQPRAAAATTAVAVAPPNIVVVMSDDQRRNTFQTMPTVRRELIQKGLRYVGFSPTSACCPARSSFLSGQHSHTTGVYNNVDPEWGGWPQFHESGYEDQTIATALDAAGYRTGLIGKYLNEWNQAPDGFVPPGWDVFRAIYSPNGQGGGRYYNYELRGTSPTEYFADNPADYSTDVVADRAVRFVKSTPADQPFFLFVTPYAPHDPFTPAPRDKNSWTPDAVYNNRAVNEQDMSDKPAFMQTLPKVDRQWIANAQDRTGESLRAVDDAVKRLIGALGDRMSNTLFVYTSDQGVMWGEHRLDEKYNPYRWATEYPLIMRWGRNLPVEDRDSLVANVDLTATLLDAANVDPGWTMEGKSVFDTFRSSVVLEAIAIPGQPAYCGVRQRNWLYVDWSGDAGLEMYNYVDDPLELNNLAGQPEYAAKEAELRGLMTTLCSPVPPGYIP